jgi:hypothetical protein
VRRRVALLAKLWNNKMMSIAKIKTMSGVFQNKAKIPHP